jgi:hypothetical protein
MSFNFPNSPIEGQEFIAIPGGVTYVFHDGKWQLKQLDAPADGSIYGRKNNAWTVIAGPTGAGIATTVSTSPPSSPASGQLWWDSDVGNLYIWYEDGTSNQWVLANATAGPAGPIGPTGPVPEAPTDAKMYARQSSGWVEVPDEVAGAKITVGPVAPSSPAINDVWIDTT